MTVLLDTCMLIALLNDQDSLHAWGVGEVSRRRPAVICDIVYCETSVAMPTRREMDLAIEAWALERMNLNDDALFRAGKAFVAYRKNKGPGKRVLPDFLIGAAAEVNGMPLLTNNASDFRGYFPHLQLVVPRASG